MCFCEKANCELVSGRGLEGPRRQRHFSRFRLRSKAGGGNDTLPAPRPVPSPPKSPPPGPIPVPSLSTSPRHSQAVAPSNGGSLPSPRLANLTCRRCKARLQVGERCRNCAHREREDRRREQFELQPMLPPINELDAGSSRRSLEGRPAADRAMRLPAYPPWPRGLPDWTQPLAILSSTTTSSDKSYVRVRPGNNLASSPYGMPPSPAAAPRSPGRWSQDTVESAPTLSTSMHSAAVAARLAEWRNMAASGSTGELQRSHTIPTASPVELPASSTDSGLLPPRAERDRRTAQWADEAASTQEGVRQSQSAPEVSLAPQLSTSIPAVASVPSLPSPPRRHAHQSPGLKQTDEPHRGRPLGLEARWNSSRPCRVSGRYGLHRDESKIEQR